MLMVSTRARVAVALLSCILGSTTFGDQAPAFDLPALDRQAEVTLAQYAGKVVYLDFWASWCAPCRLSLPRMVQLQRDLGTADFVVLAVSVDEHPAKARKFLAPFKVNYAVLHDATGKTAMSYRVAGMPTSFVINREGEITYRHVGFKAGDMAVIQQHIEALLQPPTDNVVLR
jgi:peroxiredoxin